MAGFRTASGQIASQPIDGEVEAVLLEHLQDDDVVHVKARHLARDVDGSAAAIGHALHRLQETSDQLDISTWSGAASNGTTWEVRRA